MTMTTRALPFLAAGLAAPPAALPAQTGVARAGGLHRRARTGGLARLRQPIHGRERRTRADLDEGSNAEVNEALGPIDDFIVDLASTANAAAEGGPGSVGDANCVAEAILVWAEADALSDLQTMNAQISSAVAGWAASRWPICRSRPLVTALDAEDREVIESWMRERAEASATYFDEEAPPMASRNNLRAWAGLAAAAAGLVADDEDLLDWAAGTVELVACEADEDGALPLEMGRGHKGVALSPARGGAAGGDLGAAAARGP